jgi:hypothetical protein
VISLLRKSQVYINPIQIIVVEICMDSEHEYTFGVLGRWWRTQEVKPVRPPYRLVVFILSR